MAFEEYVTYKTNRSRDVWKSSVILSKKYLRLGDDFWGNSLKKCQRVRLFFDKEKMEIGILPVQEGKEEGMKIQFNRGKNPMLKWESFVKRFSLIFDCSQTCLVKIEEGPGGMKIIEIKRK